MAVNIDIAPILANIRDNKSLMSLSMNNLITEYYPETRNVQLFSTLKTDVTCGDVIGFIDMGSDYKFMKSADGLASGCEYNECDINVTTSVKKWDTHKYNCATTICQADLECSFKDYFGLNCDADADQSNAFLTFIAQWYVGQLQRAHWRNLWFGDSTAATGTDLYGGDGYWIQALAGATASGKLVSIPENLQTTYTLQDTLDPQRGFEVYSAIYDMAIMDDQLSTREGQLEILTTKRLALNYLKYLRDNNQVNCCFKEDVTQRVYTLDTLNIFGMPIRIVHEWDQIIRTQGFADLDSGTMYSNPHRALLSFKDNLLHGVCSANMLEEVKVIYDEVTELVHFKSKYDLGATIIDEKQLILAI